MALFQLQKYLNKIPKLNTRLHKNNEKTKTKHHDKIKIEVNNQLILHKSYRSNEFNQIYTQ